jgi:anaerobic glycerol-3-phosphate dehydrogenase
MEFTVVVIKKRLDLTKELIRFSKAGSRQYKEYTAMINDYQDTLDFFNGVTDIMDYVPEYSVRQLRRQLLWLKPETNQDTINEINSNLEKLNAKRLSSRDSD